MINYYTYYFRKTEMDHLLIFFPDYIDFTKVDKQNRKVDRIKIYIDRLKDIPYGPKKSL